MLWYDEFCFVLITQAKTRSFEVGWILEFLQSIGFLEKMQQTHIRPDKK